MPEPIPIQGLEQVRRRPGMYIGGTDQRALNCCVFELIANSIKEHLAGRGSSITVTVHEDESLSVKDDGGGISVATHPQQGFLEGMADGFSELARPQETFRPDDMRPGLSAFVSVWLEDPRYGGATKDELINPEAELAVCELVANGVKRWTAESGNRAKWLAEWLDEDRNKTPPFHPPNTK